jgi:deferrochelatase/peroxidase EfeB
MTGSASRDSAPPLSTMRTFPHDRLDPAMCLGDLMVQIAADDTDFVLHALRQPARVTRGGMQARWRIDGFHSPTRGEGAARNLMGFRTASMPTATSTWG